jgi:acetyl esterase/lipase
LEAFGHNNYSKEQDDLNSVLDWILSEPEFNENIDKRNITLIGHSRGGGAVILKAAYDTRITKLVTWASVSDYKVRFPEGPILEHWKKEGVAYMKKN